MHSTESYIIAILFTACCLYNMNHEGRLFLNTVLHDVSILHMDKLFIVLP